MDIAINRIPQATFDMLDAAIQAHTPLPPAIAIAAFKDGHPVLEAAWGVVDPETRSQTVSVRTLFDLASLTKLFTSTAFLSLVSAGKVALDDSLASVVPEFGTITPRPVDGGMDPHSKIPLETPADRLGLTVDPQRVTFRHLLTHASGLAPWRDVFNAAGDAPTPPIQPDSLPQPERWRRALEALCAYPFVIAPDGVVRYSDLGLMLLAQATARLHGGTLADAIRARVTDKIGVADVRFNPVSDGYAKRTDTAPTEDDPSWRQRRVWGEVHDENACGVGGIAGHAGLFGSAMSVARLGQAWLDGCGVFGLSESLVRESTREQAVTDGERRGLGWMLKSHENSSAGDAFSPDSFGHTGFTGTSLWIDPHARLVVALMTNSVYVGRAHMQTHPLRRTVNTILAEGLRA